MRNRWLVGFVIFLGILFISSLCFAQPHGGRKPWGFSGYAYIGQGIEGFNTQRPGKIMNIFGYNLTIPRIDDYQKYTATPYGWMAQIDFVDFYQKMKETDAFGRWSLKFQWKRTFERADHTIYRERTYRYSIGYPIKPWLNVELFYKDKAHIISFDNIIVDADLDYIGLMLYARF